MRSDPAPASPRVGLVLGGGAVQGAVWLEGALAALAAETGWSPAEAEVLVGTSAGAWIATALAAGVPPWLLAAQSAGERIDGLIPGPRAPGPRAETNPWVQLTSLCVPGSAELFLRSVLPPWDLRESARCALTGWVPRATRHSGVAELVRLLVPAGWPAHRNLWCVACDYRTGQRRVLSPGGPGSPADVGQAVAASCAVPMVFRPETIAGRDHVDGGVHSVSNLDLVAGRGLDLVICLNPTSSLDTVDTRTPGQLVWRYIRRQSGRRLGVEARRVRRDGTPVLLIQPTRSDIEVLGSNWLWPSRHAEIIQRTRDSVTRQLRRTALRAELESLPGSAEHMVRCPDGPRSEWPSLVSPPALSA